MTTSPSPSNDLAPIQCWLQTAIMHPAGIAAGLASAEARQHIDIGPEEAEKVVQRSRAMTALERLSIYHHAYYARLLECLREEFPVLLHALGEELFDAFAVGYLQAYPSRSYTLFQLAAHFPHYLAETRPAPDNAESVDWSDFLIDLATLELTINEVFDGPGVERELLLDAGQLRGLPPERLLDARLVPVPCLRLLVLRYPVHKYFTAVRRHEEPHLPEPAETFLAVTRRNYVVRHYELSRLAYELLHALVTGASMEEAMERTLESAGADVEQLSHLLHTWFHEWAAEGFFRAASFNS
jgi:hypothetical protein